MKVEVTATGSGIPYRRMVYMVIGPAPELSGVMPRKDPDPLQLSDRAEKGGKIIAVEKGDPEAGERGNCEDLEATQQQLGGQEAGRHGSEG